MNETATAAYRPAYHSNEPLSNNPFCETYENQERIQVIFTILQEFSVVLVGYIVVVVVEFNFGALLDVRFIMLWATCGYWQQF